MAEMIPVRVALRIRPLSSKEIENGCDSVLDIVPGRPQITIRNSGKAFTYDNAYSTDSAQQSVYSQSVQPLIQQLFKGYNATVLAYGQTGSGKTFSMGTSNREGETPVHHEGVIPRAVRDIFEKIKDHKSDYDFCIRVAFVELYKEKLYDLLSPSSKIKEDCMVDLREDPLKGVVIANLTEVNVKDLRSTMEQLEIGSVKRVTAATAMNNTSSRSHAIFTIFIEGTRKSDSDAESADKPDNIVAKFHLVDLAGSERAKKTMATGVRYKEGVSINLGLLALGNVISALGDESGPKTHIPYRDSKLTRLLQDSLGGNSHTLMIACVSPADTNLEETISTLRYADRARKIKNKPIVNQDGKDAENAKLRREIAELKIQLLNNGGGGSLVNSKELDELKAKTATLTSENRELTSALMSCQDELSHMNEKLLLTEDSNIKLKTKLEELAAETEQLLTKTPTMTKSDLEQVLGKIKQLLDVQKDHEKSLAEHDLSRFGDKSTGDFDDSPSEEEICTTQILKQNALATQLASLNKQLAQKEQYALVLNDQESKLKEVRKKYEDQFDKMESQMKSLEKEKDNLVQQSRAEPVTSKLSEQRRKRIQELESQISDLKKKLIEQQKMIKMNEKNEQKLKTLAEEIRGMKQTKVRLIQQMKKDAEKMRMFKMQKEKEVNQLKQTERKQQVKISKMATLHTKQQNVLKRKMEEAVAANKRLKDVIDKQKAAKKIGHLGKQGLAGAAERMRNLVSQELDVVVSLKEAKQSCDQLLNDRKTLNKELADLKKKQRYTMTNDERAEMQSKIENLEGELTMRNVQIGQLQSQILDADTTDNEQNSKSSNSKWWDTLQTMTEAKIALQYLFEKAAENMASLGTTQGTYNELKTLYEEAVKNTQALEDEIINLKEDHEEQMLEAGKDYEDRVAYLLNQLTNKSYKGEVSEKDIQMFSKLQENLLKMTKEFEEQPKKQNKRENKGQRFDVKDLIDYEDDSEFEDDDSDPDWYQTPLLKRIKKIRETTLHHPGLPAQAQLKRKLGETFTENETPEQDAEGPKPKKRSGSSILGGCACKTGCKTKRCACVKNTKTCTDSCKCPLMQCENRKDRDYDHSTDQPDQSAMSDISNSTAGTMSLLNDTYQIPMIKEEIAERKITPPTLNFEDMENAAPRKIEVKESMFKSPLSAKTPPTLMQKRTSMFPSPLRE